MKHLLIHDTLEAFLKTDTDNYFFGLTTNANINKNVSQEMIRAGIGNKVVAIVSMDNEMNFDITTGLHYNKVYEIQTGEKFASSTDIKIQNVSVDEQGNVTATQQTVSGDIIDFKADSYPKMHHVQLKGLIYDPDTNEEYGNIYYIFKKGLPDGALSEVFSAANKTTDVAFTATVDEDGNYCQVAIVPFETSKPKQGSIIIYYKDEDEAILGFDVIHRDYGTHTVTAKAIPGYKVTGTGSTTVTLSASNKIDVVEFTYEEDSD